MAELAAGHCQARLRTACLPVWAVKIPHVLHEAIASELDACEETIHVPRRAQGFALVPFSITGPQDAPERFVAAVVAVDQVGAAVDAVDVGASGGMKVGRCHEQ
ncbi:hypothetical protein [Desulfonatronovibrio magnus]|uniref:hypothetical protein n=1 Tax=Desulfonatronovibrio magnus TaxID=698827 RepID=UPI0005EBE349|nr:hypothetical protein [Desulfonatronovibrio magnus]